MLADEFDVVIGVDTHRHTHTAAALSPTGAVLGPGDVPASPRALLLFPTFSHVVPVLASPPTAISRHPLLPAAPR